jgi:acyl-coenzyme A synthetase/AMP-(fatty) acid ligase
VPLNPAFPDKWLMTIIEIAAPRFLLVDKSCLPLLSPRIVAYFQDRILLVDGEPTSVHDQDIDGANRLPAAGYSFQEPLSIGPEADAYLVFTSGTTGRPNGVVISTGNLAFAIKNILDHYQFTENDRFSQFFETSFDFSVMDLFVPWQVGASTHVVPASQRLGPGHFINDQQLTVWTCVPSMINLMNEMEMLSPNIFPSLRFSCFSGAPLTIKAAQIWQEASPNSIIINLYGQTEAPIGSLAQTFNPDAPVTTDIKCVPLGKPFTGIHAAILGEKGNFFQAGGLTGELVLAGPHIANEYLGNPARTSEKFRTIDHPEYGRHTWYLTGDRVRQDPDNTFHFLGRTDNEVKISGHRITIEEIEYYLHEFTGCDEVALIPWHNHLGVAETLIGFVATDQQLDEQTIKNSMARDLPRPLVPRRIFTINKLPLNPNGKIDRMALREIADQKINL